MVKESFNPISKKPKDAVIKEMHPILIDLLDLHNQIKLAHWNLRDPNFIAVHRLFDEVAAAVLEGLDIVAERMRQLGTPIEASTAIVAKGTSLKSFPSGLLNGAEAVTAISERIATTVNGLHESIERLGEAGDPVSEDALTEVSRNLELQLWFLESHLP